ncbi:ketoacyl-ACP synthase III [Mucilaginibacter sp. dw_454]|uniref:ketoacyl-ACP synthase III n=1 Tax=Mucilaginibacter sp. dw_454 TaxID=2720079 RepID=UPI001BD5F68D|nr:ketoacyl-ACP synthase III [Mucilaginibacter sp. dw_454]
MKSAKINCIAYYLPESILSNEALSQEFPDWPINKITDKIGINQRHIAADDEFVSDMAVKACEKLFNEYNISPAIIDYILLCTQSPDYHIPTTACLVQDKLGIPTSAGALDFNQGCSGYIYGLSLAKGLITAGIAKNVLLVTSETYSKYIHKEDRGNRSIFGDAASATLISDTNGWEIGDFVLGTNGRGAQNLIVKNSGMRYHMTSSTNIDSGNYLYMDGPEIFNFTIEAIPGLVNSVIKKNELAMSDIDLFFFHQANKYMLNHLRKKIGIDEDRFVYHMQDCGNTVSSTIPIVLKEALTQGKVKKKMNMLLAGFGVGYSWGSVIIKS